MIDEIDFAHMIDLYLSPSVSMQEKGRIDAANAIFRCGGTRGVALLHRGAGCGRAKVREHCAALLNTLGAKK